jgi:flavorubredoxin
MIKNAVFVLSTLLLFSSCSQKQPLTEENKVKDNKHDMRYYQCVKKDAKNYSVNYMSINYNTNNRTEPKEEKLKRIINEKGFKECKELTEEITESYLCEKNGKKEKVDVSYLSGWNITPRMILELRFYEPEKCEKIN